MRFLFVDRITGESESHIRGDRHFGAGEPLRYGIATGMQIIAPGIISEAIGQLASWKCIRENGFTARPVFLFADRIKVYGEVVPGTLIDLEAEIHEVNAETLRFSGRAMKNGSVVQTISDCSGYFMPLSNLEDPSVTKSRYQALTNGGLHQVENDQPAFDIFSLVKDDFERTPDSIVARVCLDQKLPFYADHFPRMPVTPIVVINELIGATACMMHAGAKKRGLSVRRISGIKIKSFVRPGDELEIRINRRESEPSNASVTAIETVADIFCNGKRILRGNYTFVAGESL